MRERPILFSGPMVRALLAGTKTQTRRVVKPQPDSTHRGFPYWHVGGYRASWCRSAADGGPLEPSNPLLCPYGQPGDRLWVRETFGHFERNENFKPGCDVFYRADGDCLELEPWRPSIHIPRWASRILLEITSVRIERLQDISDEDARAEGMECMAGDPECGYRNYLDKTDQDWTLSPRESFQSLWESINGPTSWSANPWVWPLDLRRILNQQQGQQQ
ncbi:hypothetical protein DR66_2018 [Delftia acidovorans]|uniref:hypothetical protein n=1 Tax=Delftia acidovorans TaxID=80866 RepID=UPI000508D461|nr:hypothetical protein [Delftia acidovorans]KFJ11051.1 hypothetical protein DR66_2018 [Delftia acidovorans]QQB52236.1 hypothetical protein I6H54_08260 [Delftia acidovorans]